MDIFVNLLVGLGAYAGAQVTKLDRWSKYLQWAYAIGIAVIIGYLRAVGKDPHTVFESIYAVAGGSALGWGAGKMSGLGDALKGELLGNVFNIIAKGVSHVGGNAPTEDSPVTPTVVSSTSGSTPTEAPPVTTVDVGPATQAINDLNDINARFRRGEITEAQAIEEVLNWRIRHPDWSKIAPPGFPGKPA